MATLIGFILFVVFIVLCFTGAFGITDNYVVEFMDWLDSLLTIPVILGFIGFMVVMIVISLIATASEDPAKAKGLLITIGTVALGSVIVTGLKFLIGRAG